MLKYLYGPALIIEDGAFSHKIDYVTIFFGDSKSQTAFKSHYWFKSYCDFAEWVDLAYWWSFSGKGPVSAASAAGLFNGHMRDNNF